MTRWAFQQRMCHFARFLVCVDAVDAVDAIWLSWGTWKQDTVREKASMRTGSKSMFNVVHKRVAHICELRTPHQYHHFASKINHNSIN